MSFLILGFFTGLSLILAIGAQNIFVIEQGLKKIYFFSMYNLFIFRFSFNLLRNISIPLFKSIFYREFDFDIKYISFNFFNLFCFKKIIELKKINNISVELKNIEEKYKILF